MLFADTVVMVTNAAQDVSRGLIDRFAREGAALILQDKSREAVKDLVDRIKARGGEALPAPADFSREDEAEGIGEDIIGRWGRVDVLVNNAHIQKGDLRPGAASRWEAVIDNRLSEVHHSTRIMQKHLMLQGHGRIINIASEIPEELVSSDRLRDYTAVSEGIKGFTRRSSLELGRHNICVNCISLIYVESEAAVELARLKGLYREDLQEFAKALVPLKRLGTIEEVADAVLFLASEAASFISGQVLIIGGGRS